MSIILPNEQIIVGFEPTTEEPILAAAFTHGANIVEHGGAYQGAYVSTDGGLIQLGGMIRNTVALSAGAVLIKLHDVMAPIKNELATIGINGVNYAAEIDVNGDVVTKVNIGVSGTISLNSIKFLSKEVFAPAYVPDETEPTEGLFIPTIQSGTVTIMPVADVVTSKAVVFDEPFAEIPTVVLTPATTQPYTQVKGYGVANVRVDGFSVYMVRNGAVSTNIHWIATTEGKNV